MKWDNKLNIADLETLGISPDKQKICGDILDCIYKNSENTHDAKLVYKKTHPNLNETFNLCKKTTKKQTKKKHKNDPELLTHYIDIFNE